MLTWSEEHVEMRDAIRRFVNNEIVPVRDELEHGDLPPYDLLRKFYATFGLDQDARERFADRHREVDPEVAREERFERAVQTLLPMVEICRHCPGMMTALGVSTNLAGGAVMKNGSPEQQERWGLPLVTLQRVGAWAITEPDSGSDAFGSMRATARRDGDEFVLNGAKTFITNGPYADTLIFICKLDDGRAPRERQVLSFVLDRGTPGLTFSGPLRKMGLHSSPTGEVFVDDVRVGAENLLAGRAQAKQGGDKPGGDKRGARGAFAAERASMAAFALGIIEQCLEVSTEYAKQRQQFGRPIGDFQLIQEKLAMMEVARMNINALLMRYLETIRAGGSLTFGEASAMKLYSARSAVSVALDAVQIHGGNGYMTEYHVEQLARDAKVLQIYAGTDEQQIIAIARDLMRA
jgi:alkylation response protein AidB-like acyl-CoA dehydrogenase